MPTIILTDLAEAKIAQAAGSGSAVVITHVAIGDGNGASYDPVHEQTSLRRELFRKTIDSRIMTDENVWRVTAEFDAATPAISVSEIGFFDDDGDLIAIWAGEDVVPRQTGAISYLMQHTLRFTRLPPGVVIVNAPDDVFLEFMSATVISLAGNDIRQIQQNDRLAALGG